MEFPPEHSAPLSEAAKKALASDPAVADVMRDEGISIDTIPKNWFTASVVHLGPRTRSDLVVMGLGISLGPYSARFWVLRQTLQGYDLVLGIDTHDLEVLQASTNGLRDIETGLSTTGGRFTGTYRFDGHRYRKAPTPQDKQSSKAQASTHAPKPNHIFNEIVPLLRQKSSVPLRLPEYVPYSDDKEAALYGILDVAGPDGYSIQLAWTKDCEGGNACHVGYIGGSKIPPSHPTDRHIVPVTLTGGIKASFVDFDCGAHCDDASLTWTEGDFHYEISLKAGDMKALVRMANSAIRGAGPRPPGAIVPD